MPTGIISPHAAYRVCGAAALTQQQPASFGSLHECFLFLLSSLSLNCDNSICFTSQMNVCCGVVRRVICFFLVLCRSRASLQSLFQSHSHIRLPHSAWVQSHFTSKLHTSELYDTSRVASSCSLHCSLRGSPGAKWLRSEGIRFDSIRIEKERTWDMKKALWFSIACALLLNGSAATSRQKSANFYSVTWTFNSLFMCCMILGTLRHLLLS